MYLTTPDPLPGPLRIISLVPSQTELLYDLQLDSEVAGITKFCIHPNSWYTSKTRVGGTKTIDIAKIRQLQPTLIIANKEENIKDQIDFMAEDFPIWLTDINSYEDALQMINDIGSLTGKKLIASTLVNRIENEFLTLEDNHPWLNAVYLIWKDPYIAAGGGTFINSMMNKCGLRNVLEDHPRYPEINIEELKALDCKLLLLSSEPYPYKQTHIDLLQPSMPGTKIVLADGEMFSWYGSRMLLAPAYLKKLMENAG